MRLLAAILLLAPCVARAQAEAPLAAQVELTGMTFVASHDGVRDAVVEARSATLQPDTEVAVLYDVRSVFDGRPGAPGLELFCDRGELKTSSNEFHATGHVRGTTADGRTFTTDWVRYDPKRGIAFTDAPVVITENGGTYEGGGFRYHVREQRFRLLGGASVVRSQ